MSLITLDGVTPGEFEYNKDRKHYGKRRKCWSLVFPSLPKICSEGFTLKVIKTEWHGKGCLSESREPFCLHGTPCGHVPRVFVQGVGDKT